MSLADKFKAYEELQDKVRNVLSECHSSVDESVFNELSQRGREISSIVQVSMTEAMRRQSALEAYKNEILTKNISDREWSDERYEEIVCNTPTPNTVKDAVKEFDEFLASLGSAEIVHRSVLEVLDPWTKKPIQDPVKSSVCNHVYESASIFEALTKKKKHSIRCPYVGCSAVITKKNLSSINGNAGEESNNSD